MYHVDFRHVILVLVTSLAVNEKKSTEPPPISVTENQKKSSEPPSTSRLNRFKTNMVKRISRKKEISPCDTPLEEETDVEQPTSPDMDAKGRHATLAKLRRNLSRMQSRLLNDVL